MNELASATGNDVNAGKRERMLRTAGWVLSLLIAVPFVPSAWFKLTKNPQAIQGLANLGMGPSGVVMLGVVELLMIVVFLIPATSVLGGLLVTGYIGGIIVAHLTFHLSLGLPIALGFAVWLALCLREPRLRALLPVRSR
jgi:hypothetical protein